MFLTYDVLVIGAGPAGSTTAKKLAERGFQVLVLEKKTLNREKPCAGAVTNRVVEHFKIPEEAFTRKCEGIFLCGPKNRTVVVGKNPKIRFIMRSTFDKIANDKEFLALAERNQRPIIYLPGEKLEKTLNEVMNMPKIKIDNLKNLMDKHTMKSYRK